MFFYFVIDSDYTLLYNSLMIENKRKNILSEKHKEIISKNMGLLYNFYHREIEKGYIPPQEEDDFLSFLYYKFCISVLKYDKNKGFKFSTYAYGAFNFCIDSLKEKIAKDKHFLSINNDNNILSNEENIISKLDYFRRYKNNNEEKFDHKKIIKLISKIKLSEREKNVLYYKYYYQMSFHQIAKIMGVSKETSRKIFLSVIVKIKKFIDKNKYKIEDFKKEL